MCICTPYPYVLIQTSCELGEVWNWLGLRVAKDTQKMGGSPMKREGYRRGRTVNCFLVRRNYPLLIPPSFARFQDQGCFWGVGGVGKH